MGTVKCVLVIFTCTLLMRMISADDACHIGSPACAGSNPDATTSFADCCNSFRPRQSQDSYGSGPGSDSCVRCATIGCHVDKNCASETGVEVDSFEQCCAMKGRRSWRNSTSGTCHLCNNCFKTKNCQGNGNNVGYGADKSACCAQPGQGSYFDFVTQTCQTCPGMVYGDPHFIVPLLSKEVLCYSIQGYPGLAFNLIYNKNFIINAQFVDSVGDTSEATWIGKLAVIPRNSNSSDAIVFDSVDQKVTVVGHGKFKASLIRRIIISEDGKIKFTQGVEAQTGNPTVHVQYVNPQADFDVTYHSNHLNVDWNLQYDEFIDLHGLMGQFMRKEVHIDTQKQLLMFSNGRDPIPVTKDSAMTGDTGKECWKSMNVGNQGEGLIIGRILNYVVPHLLSDNLNI